MVQVPAAKTERENWKRVTQRNKTENNQHKTCQVMTKVITYWFTVLIMFKISWKSLTRKLALKTRKLAALLEWNATKQFQEVADERKEKWFLTSVRSRLSPSFCVIQNPSTGLCLTSNGPQHTHETAIITMSWQIISIWCDLLLRRCLWRSLACIRVQLVSVLHTIDSSNASNPSRENRRGGSTASQSLGSFMWKKHQLLELCTL